MPATVSLYNHTVYRFLSGENSVADTYMVNLLTAATFNATHTTLAQVGGTELPTAFGYTAGGTIATNPTLTMVGNDAKFDLNDVIWTATGGSLIARYSILWNASDSGSPPVAFIDFGEFETAVADTQFAIIWNPGGVITFSAA